MPNIMLEPCKKHNQLVLLFCYCSCLFVIVHIVYSSCCFWFFLFVFLLNWALCPSRIKSHYKACYTKLQELHDLHEKSENEEKGIGTLIEKSPKMKDIV